jgi:AcrR family transcriptional regulator
MRTAERKALARGAARELLASGTSFQDLTLRAVAEHLGWSLGTLHRAYSITAALLNDLLLEFEDATVHAVYRVGDRGLAEELTLQAHAMRDWMADPAHAQLIRYQISLAARSEIPLELALQHSRGTSWEFHREVLATVGASAGEEYADLDRLAALVAAFRDGLTLQYLSHGDLDRWLADNLAAIPVVVAVARPRRARKRAVVADRRWIADEQL